VLSTSKKARIGRSLGVGKGAVLGDSDIASWYRRPTRSLGR